LIFGTDENPQVIIGSADLMTRNLRHRIEVYVKIKKENCKKELIHYFDLQWKDNDKSVWLLPDYQQELSAKNNGTIHNAQQSIYNFLSITL
jgi:polyphosphate kinase